MSHPTEPQGFVGWLLSPERRGALLVAPAIFVLFVMNIQIYFLSPPFGPACFWLKSVAPKDITLQEIFISVIPFIFLQITGMLLVMFIPQIALWLPQALN